jgi:dCMP deaminase
MSSRPSWEVYALTLAKAASIRSEDPFRQVGACALSYDHRVLGVAYNGLKSNHNVGYEFWIDRDKRRPFMIHAECNLLSLFKRDECKILAVTLLPCECCARQIVAWNIPKVVYRETYEDISATSTLDIFNFYGIKLEKIVI